MTIYYLTIYKSGAKLQKNGQIAKQLPDFLYVHFMIEKVLEAMNGLFVAFILHETQGLSLLNHHISQHAVGIVLTIDEVIESFHTLTPATMLQHMDQTEILQGGV